MSMTTSTKKNLMLFSGRAYPELANEIARELGIELSSTSSFEFASGEIFVRFEDSVRGCDAFVIQSMTDGINTWIMETLLMIDALKRGSAKRITVVLPFYPYSRQDKKHRGREPISARLIADLLKTAGAQRILTMDLHASQIQGFFQGPVDHMFALSILAEYISSTYSNQLLAVVAPDAGRVKMAERWADRLDRCPLAFVHKTRDAKLANQIVANRVVGEVDQRVCILIDDMIDTGGTICKAADLLFEQGASKVVVAATHAILSDPAVERFKNSAISEVVITNTLPIASDKLLDKMTVLSIAPLMAQAIKEIFSDGSVTRLFDGVS